jgi:hypothetical protein
MWGRELESGGLSVASIPLGVLGTHQHGCIFPRLGAYSVWLMLLDLNFPQFLGSIFHPTSSYKSFYGKQVQDYNDEYCLALKAHGGRLMKALKPMFVGESQPDMYQSPILIPIAVILSSKAPPCARWLESTLLHHGQTFIQVYQQLGHPVRLWT